MAGSELNIYLIIFALLGMDPGFHVRGVSVLPESYMKRTDQSFWTLLLCLWLTAVMPQTSGFRYLHLHSVVCWENDGAGGGVRSEMGISRPQTSTWCSLKTKNVNTGQGSLATAPPIPHPGLLTKRPQTKLIIISHGPCSHNSYLHHIT